jgi:hypothetical protein
LRVSLEGPLLWWRMVGDIAEGHYESGTLCELSAVGALFRARQHLRLLERIELSLRSIAPQD